MLIEYFIALVGLLLLLFGGSFMLVKSHFKQRKEQSLSLRLLQIRIPKDDETKIEAGEQLFGALHGLYHHSVGWFQPPIVISCEIVARHESICMYVAVPRAQQEFLEKQIHGAYPTADIEDVEEYNIFASGGMVAFTALKSTNKDFFPIKRYKDLPTDSLNSITSAMSKMAEKESAVVQIILTPCDDSWRKKARQFLASLESTNTEDKPKIKIDPAIPPAIEEKSSKVGFEVAIRLVTVAPTMGEAKANLANLASTFDQFSLPHLGGFRKTKVYFKKSFMEGFLYRYLPVFRYKLILNIEEMATIFHFPSKSVETPYLERVTSKKAAAPQNLPEAGLYLGKSSFRGTEKPVFMSDDDRRRHMYVIGQTGTGKSEFLKFMAQQDIRNGHGVAFIDPHGDAVEDILKMIPPERANDVIYFNPSDLQRPLGLNILECKNEEQKNLVINSFIGLLYKLYDPNHSGIMGPMLERAIRNVMLTAMEEPGNSLVEVLRLLTDPEFSKQKIELIRDPLVKRYWTDEIANTNDFHKSEKLGYFVSKFDRFVTDTTMRNIIGQQYSAFDFRQVMDERKILLVNLSKGLIGEENSNFLGLILVPRLLIAAMSRADVRDEKDRPDFYLYVDEFQNFATDDFAQILSEARKYHLNLTVGNQFIGQIEPKIKDAVFGNVGTIASFRIGIDDAGYMATQFSPVFNENDLMNNTVGNAFIRLLVNGQPTVPFSLVTDWPAMQSIPRSSDLAEQIKAMARQKYGHDKADIEADIKRRAQL
jgi:hypothetical protein